MAKKFLNVNGLHNIFATEEDLKNSNILANQQLLVDKNSILYIVADTDDENIFKNYKIHKGDNLIYAKGKLIGNYLGNSLQCITNTSNNIKINDNYDTWFISNKHNDEVTIKFTVDDLTTNANKSLNILAIIRNDVDEDVTFYLDADNDKFNTVINLYYDEKFTLKKDEYAEIYYNEIKNGNGYAYLSYSVNTMEYLPVEKHPLLSYNDIISSYGFIIGQNTIGEEAGDLSLEDLRVQNNDTIVESFVKVQTSIDLLASQLESGSDSDISNDIYDIKTKVNNNTSNIQQIFNELEDLKDQTPDLDDLLLPDIDILTKNPGGTIGNIRIRFLTDKLETLKKLALFSEEGENDNGTSYIERYYVVIRELTRGNRRIVELIPLETIIAPGGTGYKTQPYQFWYDLTTAQYLCYHHIEIKDDNSYVSLNITGQSYEDELLEYMINSNLNEKRSVRWIPYSTKYKSYILFKGILMDDENFVKIRPNEFTKYLYITLEKLRIYSNNGPTRIIKSSNEVPIIIKAGIKVLEGEKPMRNIAYNENYNNITDNLSIAYTANINTRLRYNTCIM